MPRVLHVALVLVGVTSAPGRAAELACVGFIVPAKSTVGPAGSVAVSPDGRLIAVADEKAPHLAVYDGRTGAEVKYVDSRHPDRPRVVGFVPGSDRLIVGRANGQLDVFDTRQWAAAAGLTAHAGPVISLAVTPDGRYAVTGGEDRAVLVHDLATGRQVAKLEGHTRPARGVAVSADGAVVVSAGGDEVRVWDPRTGRQVAALRDGDAAGGTAVAVSPDGKLAAVGHPDGDDGLVWDLAARKVVARLRGHSGEITAARFGPDGKTVTTASADGTARTWDAATGKPVGVRRGHPGGILSLAETADGGRAVTGGQGGEAIVWAGGRPVGYLRSHYWTVWALGWAADGRALTACVTPDANRGANNIWRTWPLADGVMTDEPFPQPPATADYQAVSKDGGVRARGFGDVNTILLQAKRADGTWDAERWLKTDGSIKGLGMSDDGRTLVSVDNSGAVIVWDGERGVRLRAVPLGRATVADMDALALTPDGKLAAVCLGYKGFAVIDVAAGKVVWQQVGQAVNADGVRMSNPRVDRVRWASPTHLAMFVGDTFQVWDVATRQPTVALPQNPRIRYGPLAAGPGGLLAGVVYESLQGNTVTRASLHLNRLNGGTVQPVASVVLAARTLRESPADSDITAVAIAPDGRCVATLGSNKEIRVWAVAAAGAPPAPAVAAARPRDPAKEQEAATLLAEIDSPNITRESRVKLLTRFEKLGPSAGPKVPDLVARFGKGTEVERRTLAWALGGLGEYAVGPLIEMVADPEVGYQAVLSLRRIGPAAKPATAAFVKVLQADLRVPLPKDEARQKRLEYVVNGFHAIGADPAEAVPVLVKAATAFPLRLRQGGDWGFRYHTTDAIKQLGKYGPAAKAAVPVLIELAKEAFVNGQGGEVHPDAVQALGQIGPDAAAAVPVLQQIVQTNTQTAKAAHLDAENALRLITAKR